GKLPGETGCHPDNLAVGGRIKAARALLVKLHRTGKRVDKQRPETVNLRVALRRARISATSAAGQSRQNRTN
ncbi:MAG: hypothetical protein QGD94_08120, partial [Planctomycetia bacterium]|nr:hypothetical protein [Planctomycetia bacterium]